MPSWQFIIRTFLALLVTDEIISKQLLDTFLRVKAVVHLGGSIMLMEWQLHWKLFTFSAFNVQVKTIIMGFVIILRLGQN